jgi:phosphotransferase system enzyme I (PtsI)
MAASAQVVKGRSASPGLISGPLVWAERTRAVDRQPGSEVEEIAALRAALAATSRQIAALADAAGSDGAEILEFQLALIEDDSLLEPALAAIAAGVPADRAWVAALDAMIASYREAPDEYMQARSADLVDLRDRVLASLGGGTGATHRIPAGAVVCARDLPPSRFLEIDWSAGGGLAFLQGSPTSHVAMLARARGIPMVVQLGTLPDAAARVLLDGGQGTLEIDPSAARIAEFEASRAALGRDQDAARSLLAGPPAVFAGETVRLLINVQGLADLSHPDAVHADGIGLMRTEFLFDDPAGLPDEDTQFRLYETVLRWAEGRPVTIRTVDAGGDKPIAGFTIEGEANPFLGVRGLRLSLRRSDIFAVQLRALARAAPLGKLKVMFPMVTVPAEFEAGRDLFGSVVDDLQAAGVPAALPELGIMVEVPAAAMTIDAFPVAFASIGSNDLTQYVTACDRSNGALANLGDPRNPAVLELIRRTIAGGRHKGFEVSLCGDMAAVPHYAEVLLECGLRTFSVAPPSLAAVKRAIVDRVGGAR